MNVVKFPGGEPIVSLQSSKSPSLRMNVGPVKFTCSECGKTASVEFNNMIFRQIDCYCIGCGSFYKISNPAFVPPSPQKSK